MRDALRAVGVPAVLPGTASVFGTPAGARVAGAAARRWSSRTGRSASARRADLLPRPDRDRAARRSTATRCSTSWRDPAPLGGRAARHGGRGAARGGHAPAPACPARLLGRHGRRAAAHRPPAHRAGAARARRSTAQPRPDARWSSGCATASTRPPRTSGSRRSRRLDSDAAAVQIITVHRSKGLEFPVVYVPFGWDRYVPREPDVPAAARRRRRAGARRRRAERAAAGREHCARARGRGGGRGPAAAVRRADPRPVPGGDVVGAGDDDRRSRRCTGCCSVGADRARCRPRRPRSRTTPRR